MLYIEEMTPQKVLQKYFGYNEFRPGQLEIINAIINQQDSLAILPTGGGKSICFQIPALMLGGCTLVISPLISLMKDQVDRLNKQNISATYLNSTLDSSQIHDRYKKIQNNYFTFIYVAPERLFSKSFQNIINHCQIKLVIIDEAHCISEWGDSFRPEYKLINQWLKNWSHNKKMPIKAAFTATATHLVQKEIIHSLDLKNPYIYLQSFNRTNLKLNVLNCPTSSSHEVALMRLIKKHQHEAGIIYTATRSATFYIKNLISHFQFAFPKLIIETYHGGLSSAQRAQTQADFLENKCKLIAATNAFGMGVDKSDIRFVIHFQLPNSIENYYQEVGRAGRDGSVSRCYLLFRTQHVSIHQQLINQSSPNKELKSRSIHKLKSLLEVIETQSCRTRMMMNYFGEEQSDNCGLCDNCRHQPLDHFLLLGLSDNQEELRFERILNKRIKLAEKNLIQTEYIMTDQQLCYLALLAPKSIEECAKIPGFGDGWRENWWHEFESVI